MKVLFLGHTGLEKRQCVERLAVHCAKKAGLPADLRNLDTMQYLQVLHLEDKIRERVAGDYISYLDQFNAARQASEWGAAWDAMDVEAAEVGSKHLFVTLHATYFRKNRFFSVVDPRRIRLFDPDIVITLIDDTYDCWSRIQARESAEPRGTNLRLRDIFLWRTVEIMVGDLLTSGLSCANYVVACKHPCGMAYRLIFEGGSQRVYAAFPISATRGSDETRALVNEFRTKMHEAFTVFDPLTIDERVLTSALGETGKSCKSVVLDERLRWPILDTEMLSPCGPVETTVTIPRDQVEEAIKDIDRQIEARDYRLIDQVQFLAAYRPEFQKKPSRGVMAEMLYAANTRAIPVHLVWDDSEDGLSIDSPFNSIGVKHATTTDLIRAATK